MYDSFFIITCKFCYISKKKKKCVWLKFETKIDLTNYNNIKILFNKNNNLYI